MIYQKKEGMAVQYSYPGKKFWYFQMMLIFPYGSDADLWCAKIINVVLTYMQYATVFNSLSYFMKLYKKRKILLISLWRRWSRKKTPWKYPISDLTIYDLYSINNKPYRFSYFVFRSMLKITAPKCFLLNLWFTNLC